MYYAFLAAYYVLQSWKRLSIFLPFPRRQRWLCWYAPEGDWVMQGGKCTLVDLCICKPLAALCWRVMHRWRLIYEGIMFQRGNFHPGYWVWTGRVLAFAFLQIISQSKEGGGEGVAGVIFPQCACYRNAEMLRDSCMDQLWKAARDTLQRNCIGIYSRMFLRIRKKDILLLFRPSPCDFVRPFSTRDLVIFFVIVREINSQRKIVTYPVLVTRRLQ